MNENVEKKEFGCSHYKRRALFLTPCCDKLYMCHKCHDECESHTLDRNIIKSLICTECHTQQKIQAGCIGCGTCFGMYICLNCKIFDDEDKQQYHCDFCGICRIGENYSFSTCPVCSEEIDTSINQLFIPNCGHLLHRECYDTIIRLGNNKCTNCHKKFQ